MSRLFQTKVKFDFFQAVLILLVFGIIWSGCSPKPLVKIGQAIEKPIDTLSHHVARPFTFLKFSVEGGYGLVQKFESSIQSDGKVKFKAIQNFPELGDFEGFITHREISLIEEKAAEIRFFDLKKTYPENGKMEDTFPLTTTFLKLGSKEMEIKDNYLAPGELIDFERFILKLMLDSNLQKKDL